MFSKKGFAVVFKYIFVGLVGAIILAFFINVARQQFTLGSYKSATEIGATIDDALEAFSITPEQADKSLHFGTNLKFYVNKNADRGVNFCNQISVDKGQTVTHSKIIFAPIVLSGKSVSIWTRTWYFPFKAGSFFYISNQRIKYHLVTDDIAIRSIISEIPRNRFNIVTDAPSSATQALANSEAANFDNVKFVFFNTHPNIVHNDKIDVLEINFDSGSENKYGTLKFNDGQDTFFIGKEMLYGAVFSGNKQSYECARGVALKRLSLVADVYLKKAQSLPSNVMGNERSCVKYDQIISLLDALKRSDAIMQSTYANILSSLINPLIAANREAAGAGECVAVF